MTIQGVRQHPENVAAVINAALTLVLPAVLLLTLFVVHRVSVTDSNTSVTVHPERSFFSLTSEFLSAWRALTGPFVPLALIAGWRTRVHARRYRDGRGTGWQGVVEAGLLAFMVALLVLSRGIATRPIDALPYVIMYGGAAALLGLVFGLVLRTTARAVLADRRFVDESPDGGLTAPWRPSGSRSRR
jgi:hypothetical protein